MQTRTSRQPQGSGLVIVVLVIGLVALVVGLGYWGMKGGTKDTAITGDGNQNFTTKADVSTAKTGVGVISIDKDLDSASLDKDLNDLK